MTDAPVAYERVISDQHADDGKGYKYELVYQGLDDGDIKIAYREYVNNLARPAFTQIVEYELMAEETVIAFKGARISVEAASSNQITYVVQKGFNK